MAKRLTDNTKWDDPWFSELPSKYKLFYLYLLDECDHAGIWKVNFRKAQFMIGESLEQSEVRRYMSDRIQIIDEAYWLVVKFVKFQYSTLGGSKVSISALEILKKHGLTEFIELNSQGVSEGLGNPYQRVKDKNKAKEKDKDMDKEEEPSKISNYVLIPTIEECCQASQMSGYTAKQGEAYFHFRAKDGWMVARGTAGNLHPIRDWRSDMAHVLQKGYLDKETRDKPKFETVDDNFTF